MDFSLNSNVTNNLMNVKILGATVKDFASEYNLDLTGIDSAKKLPAFIKKIQAIINDALMDAGVIILEPESTYIDRGVRIGEGSIIYPNVHIEGTTVIGKNCEIGPNSRLRNMTLDDNVSFQYSIAVDSSIGSHTVVGPFAYIRPHSNIGSHVKVGDFVEVKNSKIGDNTKMSHLTYIGDSEVGDNVNFGCGTVTVNYDGKKKHRTIIGHNAFIGCNTNIVSPVNVGDGAYIAAGSTITEDVPEKSLAIARTRQVNKGGWTDKRDTE